MRCGWRRVGVSWPPSEDASHRIPHATGAVRLVRKGAGVMRLVGRTVTSLFGRCRGARSERRRGGRKVATDSASSVAPQPRQRAVEFINSSGSGSFGFVTYVLRFTCVLDVQQPPSEKTTFIIWIALDGLCWSSTRNDGG
jgi:hypothetical protein